MPHFLVSLNLVADKTREQRHIGISQFMRQVVKGFVWDETIAFYALQADGDAESFCTALVSSGILADEDRLLVIDLDNRRFATRGCQSEILLKIALGF